MNKPELDFLVLRSDNLEASMGFYSLLGLTFREEKHGDGPTHYSAQLGQIVMELYPLGKRKPTADVRYGLLVDSVDRLIEELEPIQLVSPASNSDRGRIAVVIDPDGHTIELIERNET